MRSGRRLRGASSFPVRRECSAILCATALVLLACGGGGVSPKTAREQAERDFHRVAAESSTLRPEAAVESAPDSARLLADGELLLAAGQFEPAAESLSQVVLLGATGGATPEEAARAQALLGEAYFRGGELLSAQRELRVVAASDAPAFRSYRGLAAARLVDVAMASGDEAHLPQLLELTEGIYTTDRSPSVAYARAKVLFALGRHADASAQAAAVGGDELSLLRASYLRATSLMKQAQARGRPLDYSAAIDEFERLATRKLSQTTADASEIQDLARLAVARLNYETGLLSDAAKSYQQIASSSVHSPTALFELGWTYVRMGDYRRAEQSLAHLAERSPGLIDGAEAALLRADLMLRSGRFRDAERVYEQTRDLYSPIITRLEGFLAAHPESAVYYDKLLASEIEVGADLPKLVVDWAREIAGEQSSFAVVDEVARTRQLLERTERMAALSLSAMSSGAGVKAFPQTRQRLKAVIRLQNELARVGWTLATGLDAAAGAAEGELADVRTRRRALMKQVEQLPVSDVDFTVQDLQERKRWDDTLESLQKAQLTADQMRALANGLRRVLSDARRGLVSLSAESQREYTVRLSETDRELASYHLQVEEIRRQIEIGRQQVGLGGEQTEEDAKLRQEFAQLLERELSLSAQGQDGKGGARGYSSKSLPLLEDMGKVRARLAQGEAELKKQAAVMGRELALRIVEQTTELAAYSQALEEFDQAARELVGEIARQSFVDVRERLVHVVLRADLGLVQKSWETREEQRRRVQRLLRERSREQLLIDQEQAEVLDTLDGAP